MIDDGYGEGMTLADAARLVEERDNLLHAMASERTSRTDIRDDVVQEGRIAIWQAVEKAASARNPGAYLNTAARHRIINVITADGGWFGHTGGKGKPVDPLRRPKHKESIDDPDFTMMLAAPDVIDEVMWGYHTGQIVRAINSLPVAHREYVVLRFWGGWTNVEIAAHQHRNANNMARTWTEAIAPALARELAHLA